MGADIKAVRVRMKSVDSTRHITRAMELVASAKIKKATDRMDRSRLYKKIMLDSFASLAREKNPYTAFRSRELPALFIVIAGDRGLAGGYNSSIFRSASAVIEEKDIVIPIGKRAVEHFRRRGGCISEEYLSTERFTEEESAKLARLVRDMYDREEISAVNLISTKFVSVLTRTPEITYILPIREKDGEVPKENVPSAVIEYEPDPSTVMKAIIPDYISGIIYSSVCESFASELAARRSAMDTATKNADEMLADLNLKYNRARQGAITQEITEIVAGANA